MVSKFFKFILLNLYLADEVKFYSGINLKFEYKITKLKTRKINFNKNLNRNLKKRRSPPKRRKGVISKHLLLVLQVPQMPSRHS